MTTWNERIERAKALIEDEYWPNRSMVKKAFDALKDLNPPENKPEILHKGFCDDGPGEADGRVSIISLLTGTGLAKDNSDARRMVKAGAVMLNGRRKLDSNSRVWLSTEGYLLMAGKTKMARVYLVDREPDCIKDLEPAEKENNRPISGPCSYCGHPDHWRPDCPELKPRKSEPLVRNPDGKIWVLDILRGIFLLTEGDEPEALNNRYVRTMTRNEAFMPGAIVQATATEDGESVTGRMTHGYDGKVYVTCFDQEFGFCPYELTLVKPAPEKQ